MDLVLIYTLYIVIPPKLTQLHFLIGGKCVTCHESRLTNPLGRTKLTNNNMNFRLAHNQVMFLEKPQIYEPASVKLRSFF